MNGGSKTRHELRIFEVGRWSCEYLGSSFHHSILYVVELLTGKKAL